MDWTVLIGPGISVLLFLGLRAFETGKMSAAITEAQRSADEAKEKATKAREGQIKNEVEIEDITRRLSTHKEDLKQDIRDTETRLNRRIDKLEDK